MKIIVDEEDTRYSGIPAGTYEVAPTSFSLSREAFAPRYGSLGPTRIGQLTLSLEAIVTAEPPAPSAEQVEEMIRTATEARANQRYVEQLQRDYVERLQRQAMGRTHRVSCCLPKFDNCEPDPPEVFVPLLPSSARPLLDDLRRPSLKQLQEVLGVPARMLAPAVKAERAEDSYASEEQLKSFLDRREQMRRDELDRLQATCRVPPTARDVEAARLKRLSDRQEQMERDESGRIHLQPSECPECYGSGFHKGFGAPCSRGCSG